VRNEIVMGVGGALVGFGLVMAILGALPATQDDVVVVPADYQFAGVYYGGLVLGSVEAEYEVDSGRAMQVYVFSAKQYDSYYDDVWIGCVYQEVGSSGCFSFDMADAGDYYVVFEHENLANPLDERVAVDLTVNGISILSLVLTVSFVVLGAVLLFLGRRMKARAALQESPARQL